MVVEMRPRVIASAPRSRGGGGWADRRAAIGPRRSDRTACSRAARRTPGAARAARRPTSRAAASGHRTHPLVAIRCANIASNAAADRDGAVRRDRRSRIDALVSPGGSSSDSARRLWFPRCRVHRIASAIDDVLVKCVFDIRRRIRRLDTVLRFVSFSVNSSSGSPSHVR